MIRPTYLLYPNQFWTKNKFLHQCFWQMSECDFTTRFHSGPDPKSWKQNLKVTSAHESFLSNLPVRCMNRKELKQWLKELFEHIGRAIHEQHSTFLKSATGRWMSTLSKAHLASKKLKCAEKIKQIKLLHIPAYHLCKATRQI